ncbi:MAG: ABC transporter substrate-binding protein, partial [Vicinamibacterales bacterium]
MRRLFLILVLLAAPVAACGGAGGPGAPPAVRIAVGGQSALRFFPVYLAQELGLFDQAGVSVTIDNLSGSARGMQALLGGSADVAAGFYDQTIQIAAKGRDVRSFVVLTRYLGFVATAAPGSARTVARMEDLKGGIVGVAAPGSSGHLLLNYLLSTHGMAQDDVSIYSIGTGATSVAAMTRGAVDAGVIGDLVLIPLLAAKPDLAILADTRTAEGIRETFGVSAYPGSVLYATADWLGTHEDAARRVAAAMQASLRWALSHTPAEVRDRLAAVYPGQDPAMLLEALEGTIRMLSPDGVMAADAPPAVRDVLAGANPKVTGALDLSR